MTVRLSGLAEEQMRTILSNYRSGSNNTTKKTDSSQEQGNVLSYNLLLRAYSSCCRLIYIVLLIY